MKSFLLVHPVKNPPPGTVRQMAVLTEDRDDELEARAFAADKAGIEGPAAWLDHTLTTCQQFGLAFPSLPAGVLVRDQA